MRFMALGLLAFSLLMSAASTGFAHGGHGGHGHGHGLAPRPARPIPTASNPQAPSIGSRAAPWGRSHA